MNDQNQLILDLDAQETKTEIYLGWLIEARLFHRTVSEGVQAPTRANEQSWIFTDTTDVWETWIESSRWGQRFKVQGAASYWTDADRAIEATRSYIRNFYSVDYCNEPIPTVPDFGVSEPGDRRTCELRPVSKTRGLRQPSTVWYVALIHGQAEAIVIEGKGPFKTETGAWSEIEQMQEDCWVY